jgi:molybdate transport system substrate-binding protein
LRFGGKNAGQGERTLRRSGFVCCTTRLAPRHAAVPNILYSQSVGVPIPKRHGVQISMIDEAGTTAVRPIDGRASWQCGLLAMAAIMAGMMTQVESVRAAPVKIYAAGSLKAAMEALIKESGAPADGFAEPVFGPAGLLRERLSKGEPADLFASADMAQPIHLAEKDTHILVVPFAANLMCLVSKASAGITAANVLSRMLSPDFRLATSTPGADPGGDYAVAMFDKADQIRPGSGAILRSKAQHLLGGPTTMVPVAGRSPAASIFVANQADALVYYCSAAPALLKDVGGLVSLPLPETLEVHPTYGMAILSDKAEAARFALFVVSLKGQAILARFGFLPVTATQ